MQRRELIYNEDKNQPAKLDPKMAKMIELEGKDVKSHF